MPQTLPAAADQTTEYEDFYESTLAQPLGTSDTDIFPETMPQSVVGFLVIGADTTTPEIIFYNDTGVNFVRCPSATDGNGRGVFNTTPGAYDEGTKIGMYSIAAFYELIVTGRGMRDGFIQARHFSSSIDPNNFVGVGQTLTFGSDLGQHVATYVVTGDQTGKFVRGTSFQLPRVTAVNTHYAALTAASSQYFTKSSPTGISFTGPFTAEALVRVRTIGSATVTVLGKLDAARTGGGWNFGITSSGAVIAEYGSGSSFTDFISYQSLPLNQWVHIGVAVTSVSSKTAVVYINGIPVDSTSSHTAATSLVQASVDLRLGAASATTTNTFADIDVQEVRLWSTARTGAQIAANYDKPLAGSESNLIAYYPLDGDSNDHSPTGNNMTASGGALATTLGGSWTATEWGKVVDVAFSAGNTTISMFTGNKSAPPNEDITNASYTYSRTPPGMPNGNDDWTIFFEWHSNPTPATTVAPTAYQPLVGSGISVPIGKWWLEPDLIVTATAAGSVTFTAQFDITTPAVVKRGSFYGRAEGVTGFLIGQYHSKDTVSMTVQTKMTMYVQIGGTGGVTGASFERYPETVRLICPYV